MTPVTKTEMPLPDKPVHKLNKRDLKTFRQWMSLDPGGPTVAYPTAEEKRHRQKRERWKARFLTPCSELITYRSPGWRTQHEITANPGQYLDTIVLRNRKKSSQFLVVYEITNGRPQLRHATVDTSKNDPVITLSCTGQKKIAITMPGAAMQHSETVWRVTKA